MPRPRKCRKVCHLPDEKEFLPSNGCQGRPVMVMTVDEYETIRLIDYQAFLRKNAENTCTLHAPRYSRFIPMHVRSLPGLWWKAYPFASKAAITSSVTEKSTPADAGAVKNTEQKTCRQIDWRK